MITLTFRWFDEDRGEPDGDDEDVVGDDDVFEEKVR